MSVPPGWVNPPDLKAATGFQREIAAACETVDRFGSIAVVAGADTSMKWRDRRGPIHAAIAAADPAFAPATATIIPRFPYVSGYLGFREVPALLGAWDRLVARPDLILVDGQGRSHPRRCGNATHLGVVLDLPTIGIAKTVLCGIVDGELSDERGAQAPLVDRGEIVGMALRTRPRAAPIYVSIGHRISLESAVELVLSLSDRRRLPPPIRAAHDAANAARRAYEAALT